MTIFLTIIICIIIFYFIKNKNNKKCNIPDGNVEKINNKNEL